MSFDSLLNRTVTLKRPTPSIQKDTSGGKLTNFQNVDQAADIPCTIQPLSNKVKQWYAQRQVYNTHRIYFAADIYAKRQDILVADDGKIYVFAGDQDMAGRQRYFFIDVTEQAP